MFEPTPLLTRDSKHGLDYWWVKTGELDLECKVASLSWNHEGTRLLTAGQILQMWKYSEKTKFDMGEETEDLEHTQARSMICTLSLSLSIYTAERFFFFIFVAVFRIRNRTDLLVFARSGSGSV